MARPKATPAARRRAAAMYQQGATLKEVASRYGVHHTTVVRWLETLGVRRRHCGRWAGKPQPQRPDIAALVAAYRAGLGMRRLARQRGVSPSVILKRLKLYEARTGEVVVRPRAPATTGR